MMENTCTYFNTLSPKARVCCLYRVSTTKQVDHDANNQADIPVQRKACREFADRMGWSIVYEEQESGVSGFKISANDRDAIQKIKEYAEQDKFDILLVFMFDRIGRRAEETPFVVEWFVKHGIQVWSVNEGEQRIDSHVDRLTNYIRFWQADGESQKTSIRTKTALNQMVQEGRFRGGIAPYGYDLVGSGILNKRKHEVYKLVINEEEAKVVRLIYDLCIGSGFGRTKIGNVLTSMGIKTREGKNWSDASIARILHSKLYIGILKNGESESEIIPELQIISPENYELAQKILAERAAECNYQRTMPLTTRGQTLLSGNIFCGHCGARLNLTTNGTVYKNSAGEKIPRRRIRYVCYNKTRKHGECNGQTGYTTHILDQMIIDVLHEIFRKMQAADPEEIIARTSRNATVTIEERLKLAKAECSKATAAYESLKDEVVKAVQGRSSFSMDILSELVDTARAKMLDSCSAVTMLNDELAREKQRLDAIALDYQRVMGWADIFDKSEMPVKKMIVGYIIKRIDVYADYHLHIELNMNVEQFDLGLDFKSEPKTIKINA